MKLKSFRIFRYKSIVDSGECTLSPDFTILIGKNESGKTAILEALRDFDIEQRGLSSQAVTLNGASGNPEIQMTFEITASQLDAAVAEAGITLSDEVRQKMITEGLTLRKTFGGEYRFSDNDKESFSDNTSHAGADFVDDRIAAKKQRLSEILKVHLVPDLKLGQDVQALQDSISELRRLVKSRLNFINDESEKVEAVEILHSMTNSVASDAAPATPYSKFLSKLVKQLPRFIYFSDFKDILPFEISIDALKNNQTVCDFAHLAQLDLDTVMTTQDIQRRINLLNRASAVITGIFFENWEQDRIELVVRPEGNKVLFGVKEHSGTDFYKMDQRSRGFQWFLSFYLRISRYQNENVVLLIDEPGMNLHPMAQKNILRVIEQKVSPSMTILFSTHSPSLIDNQHLDRIRYVVKNIAVGSVIVSDIADAVDIETLMPVSIASGISYEQLKALSLGEKAVKPASTVSRIAPELTAEPAQPEQPFVDVAAAAPHVTEQQQSASDLPSEKTDDEKISQDAQEQTESDDIPRRNKPLFNFFGR